MGPGFKILGLIALVGLTAGGCCKTLWCDAKRTAQHNLGCLEVELTEVTDQIRRDKRDLPADRRYQMAKGCGQKITLECGLVDSGVVHGETRSNTDATTEISPEFSDPHWRCWEYVDRPRELTGDDP